MSGLPYIPGHIIDEAKDQRRQGHSLESLASRLGIAPEALGILLGESVANPGASDNAADEFDLWRSDELAAQL